MATDKPFKPQRPSGKMATPSAAPNIHVGGPQDVQAPYDAEGPQTLSRGSDRNSKTLEVGSYQSADFIASRTNAAAALEQQGWRLNARKGADGLANVFIGSGVPATVPTRRGDIYVDYTNAKVYVSCNIAVAGDWKILN